MSAPDELPCTNEAIRDAAAQWTVRRDRGLSAAESIEFELWVAADERHSIALRRTSSVWSKLDRMPEGLAEDVLQSARCRRRWRRRATVVVLAAAAAVVITSMMWHSPRLAVPIAATESDITTARTLTLVDGTLVHLNSGSRISEHYTRAERRVRLLQGEAHFNVTKNAARPFVVEARGVDVCAVGTAFNVSLQSAAVEVLVTEGVVKLAMDAGVGRGAQPTANSPLLNRGQKAIVGGRGNSVTPVVEVTNISGDEIERALAWREPLLRLGGATLAEVAATFEMRTGRRIIMADPELAGVRLGGRFRADDVDGFANLLETLGIEVEHLRDGSFVLRKKKQNRHNGN
jgi:transmembrane sensor